MVCLWYAAELALTQLARPQGKLEMRARRGGLRLKLPVVVSSRRMGSAVGALLTAASIGLAFFVYFGYEHKDRYVEAFYYKPVLGYAPVAQAAFDIYVKGGRLYYIKEGCAGQDIADTFFLHIYPVSAAVLSSVEQPHGFANLDFGFAEQGIMTDGKCGALVELPRYAIARIHTGQYVPDGARLWAVEFKMPPAPE